MGDGNSKRSYRRRKHRDGTKFGHQLIKAATEMVSIIRGDHGVPYEVTYFVPPENMTHPVYRVQYPMNSDGHYDAVVVHYDRNGDSWTDWDHPLSQERLDAVIAKSKLPDAGPPPRHDSILEW